jgi:hypothetical protein
MGWFQLAAAVVGLAREIFKYLKEHEENNKACAIKVTEVKNAIHSARKTKDTANIESAFASLSLRS